MRLPAGRQYWNYHLICVVNLTVGDRTQPNERERETERALSRREITRVFGKLFKENVSSLFLNYFMGGQFDRS